MPYSAEVNRFIVKAYLNSMITNDLKENKIKNRIYMFVLQMNADL